MLTLSTCQYLFHFKACWFMQARYAMLPFKETVSKMVAEIALMLLLAAYMFKSIDLCGRRL